MDATIVAPVMNINDVLKINGRFVPRNKIVPNKCNECLNAKVFCKCDDSEEEQATIVAPVRKREYKINPDRVYKCKWYAENRKAILAEKNEKNKQPEVRAKIVVSVKKRYEAQKQAKLASGEYVVAKPTAEGKRPKIIKKSEAEKKTQKTPKQQYNKAYYEQHKEKLNQGRKEYDAKRYKERKQQKTADAFQHPIKPNYPPPPPPSYASLFSKSNWVEEDF